MHTSGQACKQFLHAISRVLLRDIVDEVKRSPYFSLIIDGSKNRASKEAEIVYVSYIGHNCLPKTQFFGIKIVKDGTATTIVEKMKDLLNYYGFSDNEIKKKLVAIATDGATISAKQKASSLSFVPKYPT